MNYNRFSYPHRNIDLPSQAVPIQNNTYYNSQINNATGSATINATQYGSVDMEALKGLIANIKLCLPNDISSDDSELLSDNLEVIEYELSQGNPRKGLVRTAITGLKAIKGSTEFGATIAALIQFVQQTL